jgi:ankyrin repeat protein
VEPAPRPNAITPKYNDVMTAVLRGDKEAVRELLDLGWWVDKPSANGITPLMAAVMNQDAPMVQLLLDHGAEPSVQALNLARKNKDAASASLLEQKGAR